MVTTCSLLYYFFVIIAIRLLFIIELVPDRLLMVIDHFPYPSN